MAARLQTKFRDVIMAVRWCTYMDNARTSFMEKLLQVAEILLDSKPLTKLARHEGLGVTDADNLAAFDPLNLRGMIIGDLAAAHDGHFKHGVLRSGRLQSSGLTRRRWTPSAPIPGATLVWHCYTAFSSSSRAIFRS